MTIQLPISEVSVELQKIAAGGASAYRMHELARSVEYAQLDIEQFSNSDIDVYRQLFECTPSSPISGLEYFVAGIFSDFYKLSPDQSSLILGIFLSNLENYTPTSIQALADLVARKYPLDVSIDAFRHAWKAGGVRAKEFADFGAQVLSLIIPRQGIERDSLRRFGEEMRKQ